MRRVKYLEIKLLKVKKDLSEENYKTLMKEINNNTNWWRDTSCFWIGIINIVKMNIILKAIYRFNVIPIKLSVVFFTELEQKNFTICVEAQKNPNSQNNLEKENIAEWFNPPNFRLHYKATVIKYTTSTKTEIYNII